ncbi:X-ray radiation resistance-associated protein 1, partial [Xyrauchen texanus]|uniref:X-ray radiation resistance-associated protein 1 n=1 Tax=Xyrauchen texanus TaxID=154827 RepID=UPI002241D18F
TLKEMAGLGIYKLDDGESYPSHCFPIRSFFLPTKEGAGYWLVAHRKTLEERISKRKKASGSSFEVHSKKHEQGRPASASNTLDAQLLIKLHCVDKPSDLCSVHISDQGLQTVKHEGLENFDNIAYINASDNSLTLEDFSRFPALRELELSLNGLQTLEVHAEDFQNLEVLDLSFNKIAGESILNLGLLPRLKDLHLTGNQLQMLPLNMAGPRTCTEETTHQCVLLFKTLEVLMLDDNKLSSPGVFLSLANLKRLHHLNLQGNYISGVPFLEQMATLQDAQTSMIPHSIKQRSGSITSPVQEVTVNGKRIMYPEILMSQQKSSKRTYDENKACLATHSDPSKYFDQTKEDGYSEDFCLPFPELHHLNLANNEIAEEEALLPVALFPKLSELVIHSNPLTTQRSGDPPILTCFLQDKLGIKIKRKKTTDLVKPHIALPFHPERKVKTKVPEVPKSPLFMANQQTSEQLCIEKHTREDSPRPPEYGATHVFGSSSQTSIEEEDDIAIGDEHLEMASVDLSCEANQNAESFFVTEVHGLHESDCQEEQDDANETSLMMKKDRKACPKKLIDYEILLDETPEPEMFSGIQHAVSVLEHTLKNLLVYRDSKANLDRPQKPYTERKKKIINLPPLGPKKSKGEKVEEILTQIKETKTISKVPLGNVLNKRNDTCKREYEEALNLLKDMKRRYRMTHLKTVEQAAQLETEKTCNNLN